MTYIGIDAGVHTGIAVWHAHLQELTMVESMTITQAMEQVRMMADVLGRDNVRVYIEDARKRTWFGSAGRERLMGAGSVKRDSQIWDDFCREQDIEHVMVPPKNNRTKLSAEQFRRITNYKQRTNEHGRDAACLVFGK